MRPGSVVVIGARALTLITNIVIADVQTGAVIVDIAIAQGGNSEPARPTTHAEPAFLVGPCSGNERIRRKNHPKCAQVALNSEISSQRLRALMASVKSRPIGWPPAHERACPPRVS